VLESAPSSSAATEVKKLAQDVLTLMGVKQW